MLKFPFGEQQDNSFQDYKVTFARTHASAMRGRLICRRVIVSYLPTVPHSTGLSRKKNITVPQCRTEESSANYSNRSSGYFSWRSSTARASVILLQSIPNADETRPDSSFQVVPDTQCTSLGQLMMAKLLKLTLGLATLHSCCAHFPDALDHPTAVR